MAEVWKYYLRIGPIRIPLGSRISHLDEIEKPEFKTRMSLCNRRRPMKGKCGRR